MEIPTDDRAWNLQIDTCRIDLWRGYTTARFVARIDADDAGALEVSSTFSWRAARTPDSQEAKLAHYELVSRLKAQGWTPTGRGEEWYETELSRPTLVEGEAGRAPEPQPGADPEPPAVADLDPEPEPEPQRAPEPRRAVVLAASTPEPRSPRNAWQAVALVGLLLAIALLVFVAVHGA